MQLVGLMMSESVKLTLMTILYSYYRNDNMLEQAHAYGCYEKLNHRDLGQYFINSAGNQRPLVDTSLV